MQEPKYDRTEAYPLLTEADETSVPAEDAKELLTALHNVCKRAEYSVDWKNADTLRIGRGHGIFVEVFWGDGMVWVEPVDNPKKRRQVPLKFNAESRMIAGGEADGFYVPVPGQPIRKRRAALATVVDVILDFVGERRVTSPK